MMNNQTQAARFPARLRALLAVFAAAALILAGLVIPSTADGNSPAVKITIADVDLEGPAVSKIVATLTNTGGAEASNVTVNFTGPINWTLYPRSVKLEAPIAAGASVAVESEIFVPQNPAENVVRKFTVKASYELAGAQQTSELTHTQHSQGQVTDTLAELFNNVATTSLATLAQGNFDGDGNSFSREKLETEGNLTSGGTIEANEATFTWPATAAGEPDNIAAEGQSVKLNGRGTSLVFLGSSPNGSSGAVTVNYTDGSTGTGTMSFGRWYNPQDTPSAKVAIRMAGRNTPAGLANTDYTYGWYTSAVKIDSTRTVASVTLPNSPELHVFSIALLGEGSSPEVAESFAALHNNVGSTTLDTRHKGNFDGDNNSFSRELLAEKGVTPASIVEAKGAKITWPASAAGEPDNVIAQGQKFKFEGKGGALVFLGSAIGNGGSGQMTIHYSDGSLGHGFFGFPNWLSVDGFNADPVIELQGRNTPAGLANTDRTYSIFATSVPIDATRNVAAITLPVDGNLHVFGLGLVEAAPSPSPSPSTSVEPSASPSPSSPVEPSASPSPSSPVEPSATPTVKPTGIPSWEPSPPYTVPGTHELNGRRWNTSCEKYSQTQRCRTDIWATTVTKTAKGFEVKQGWAFNNLTYLPYLTRAQWEGNPLGKTGQWRAADGRQWRTECDTAATGRGACRSYTMTTVYKATPKADGYAISQSNQWLFNNIVMFRQ